MGVRRATLPPVDCTDFFVSANSIRFQIRGTEALACQEPGGRGLLSRYSNNNNIS